MYPYDVTATADPDVVLVTNFLSDVNGVQVIRGGQVTDVQLVLGELAGGGHLADTFDVSNAREIVITPDGRYAFVIGYTLPSAVDVARRHGFGQLGSAYKAGSNIGIIENPLTAPKLIAATRPLPFGFMTDLQISEDGHTLSVTLPNIQIDTGGTGALFEYDVDAIIAEIDHDRNIKIGLPGIFGGGQVPILSRIPVNDIVNGVWDFTAAKYNTAIDLNAAYRPVPDTGNFFVNFEIYDAEHAPLGIGGHPSGLVTNGINAAPLQPQVNGLQDNFFSSDGKSFELEFTNAAEKKTPGSALTYELTFDGPAADFLDGLPTLNGDQYTFELASQGTRTIRIQTKEFASRLKDLDVDQLYMTQITIKAYPSGSPTNVLFQQTINVGRYVSVVDPDARGFRAYFLKTLNDGTEGFVREKQVAYHLPSGVDTTFEAIGTGEEFFELGGPLRNDGVVVWQFDPTADGTFQPALDVLVDGHPVATPVVALTATAVPRLTVGLNFDDFESEMEQLLDKNPSSFHPAGNAAEDGFEIYNYTAANGSVISITSTDDFVVQFGQYFGGANVGPARSQAIRGAFDAMKAAVTSDLNVGPIPTFDVVDGEGDVTVAWYSTVTVDNQLVAGAFTAKEDFDRSMLPGQLRSTVSSSAAKEYALAEALNTTRTNELVNVGIVSNAVAQTISFGNYLANTLTHEIGHSLGLHEGYLVINGRTRDQFPYDVMMSGHASDVDLRFGAMNTLLVQAGAGIAPNDLGALKDALEFFKLYYNAPDPGAFSRPAPEVGGDHPQLVVAVDDTLVASGDAVAVPAAVADGAGASQSQLTLVLYNFGQLPLTLSSLRLTDGGQGFSIAPGAPVGDSILPGEFATITVLFDPDRSGQLGDVLEIGSNADADPLYSIALTGSAISSRGQITLSLGQNNLGGALPLDVAQVSGAATIHNTGAGPLTIYGFRVVELTQQFAVSSALGIPRLSAPIVLAAGESLDLDASYTPSSVGLERGIVEIVTDDPDAPVTRLTLVGTGLPGAGDPRTLSHAYVVVTTYGAQGTQTQRLVTNADGSWHVNLASDIAPCELLFSIPPTDWWPRTLRLATSLTPVCSSAPLRPAPALTAMGTAFLTTSNSCSAPWQPSRIQTPTGSTTWPLCGWDSILRRDSRWMSHAPALPRRSSRPLAA